MWNDLDSDMGNQFVIGNLKPNAIKLQITNRKLQMPVKHARFVFEVNRAIFSMGAKDPLEFLHHRRIAGMTLERRVRRRPQSSGESFVVKLLAQAENALLGKRGRKKLMDHGGRALVAHSFIVSAVSQQELFVFTQERRACGLALVPDQDAPSVRPQNADEFRAGAG